MSAQVRQVIELKLARIHEMFELPQSDLFSEYRNFLTGVDFCISELRGRRSRQPVRIEISLPSDEIGMGMDRLVARTLQRYCDHRTHYNTRERRALWSDGASALRLGLPITALGLGIVALDQNNLVSSHLGWVLACGSRSTPWCSIRWPMGGRTASSSCCAMPRW